MEALWVLSKGRNNFVRLCFQAEEIFAFANNLNEINALEHQSLHGLQAYVSMQSLWQFTKASFA